MRALHLWGVVILAASSLAAEPIALELEPTVVTAKRAQGAEEEDPLRSPGNDTLIDREVIADSVTDSVADLLEFQAGVTSRSFTGSSNQGVPVLRGFGENAQLRTLILLDGLPLNRDDFAISPWSQVPLASLQSIRVLRGGRTVRYGSGATAGVISLTTREGQSELGGSLEARFGSDESYRQEATFTLPLADWTVAGQVSNFTTDGYRDNSAREESGLNLSLSSPAGEALVGRLTLSANTSFFEDPGPLSLNQFEENPRQSTRDGDEVLTRSLRIAPSLEWTLSPTLTLTTQGALFLREREIDFAGSRSENDSQAIDFESVLRWESDALAVEGGVRGHLGSQDFARSQTIALREERQLADLSRDTFGAFLLASVELREQWDWTAGVSWDRYELAVDANSPEQPNAPELNFADRISEDGFSFELGLEYDLTPESQLWVRYDQSIRFPILDEVAFFQGFPSNQPFNTELEAERGDSIEAGYRYQGESLGVNLTGFSQWLENEIAFDAFNNRNDNLPETWRLGSEARVAWEGEHWRAQANYTYILARFRRGLDDGRRVPLVPRHTLAASMEWLPTENLTLAVEGSYLTGSPDGNDRGDTAQFIDLSPLEGRTLWNLRANWQVTENWNLFGRLDNVFDERFASSKFSDSFFPGAGRQATIGSRVQF